MAFRIILYSIANESNDLEYQSPMIAIKDDTYAMYQRFLEAKGHVDFPFDF